MSGKFMNVKRIMIPTITMVIIASQLMGCAAANQSELLQMINNGDMIEIEVSVPVNEEQGTEQSIIWEQLASLETNDVLRSEWDNILGITNTETGKNGVLYVNAEGNNENNNTLRVALHNRAFVQYLENEKSLETLAEAAQSQYVDLETDETMKSVYMGINGYFNLLPDADVNYSNPDSTLNRLEFMTMVMRAETPVAELTADSNFAAAVGNNDLNIYAQEVAEDSYLTIADKSLNNMTANGTITRAEVVYMLMNHYFPDELANVDLSTANLSDCIDGGNIAEAQNFIEDGVAKDYWKSYELTYAIANPTDGCPTDLYTAMVLAEQKGIIDSETRWDEGITKAEAVEMLVATLQSEAGVSIFNYQQGTITGYEVVEEDANTNENQSIEDINDAGHEYAPSEEVEEVKEETTPSENTFQWPDEETREWFRTEFNLTEDELNNMTQQRFDELLWNWVPGGSNNGGGSNSGGNNGGGSNNESDAGSDDDIPWGEVPSLNPGDGSLPGQM